MSRGRGSLRDLTVLIVLSKSVAFKGRRTRVRILEGVTYDRGIRRRNSVV